MRGAAVTLAPHIPEQPHPSHDLRGLQTEARFDSLSGEGISNQYDGFGRLASSATTMDGTTRTLAYQYDRDGNRTRITHPDSVQFDYSYDGLDRPTWLSDPSSALTHLYEPWGTVSGIIRIGGASGRWRTPDGRLISLSHYDGPSFTLDTYWAFAHNPAGQIATQWGMSDFYAWTGHYAVQRPYTTNGLNQYSQTGSGAGTAAFTYDANGNLVTQTVQSVTQTYVYDIENRLVGAPGNVVLTYDPLGRLYAVSSPSTDTRFLYDGDALVGEYNAAGTLLRRYVHDIGADVPAIQYEGTTVSSATRRYLLANAQGSIVAATDGSSVIQSRNTYDEYGIPGAGNAGRFQYTGQIWLAELGMYHYKARIYSPTLGRFLQTDPVGYEGGMNLYAYVGNDPINNADPSGLYRCGTLDRDQCAAFNGAQEDAKSTLRIAIGGLRQLRSHLGSRRLTGGDRRWQARLNLYLGRGAGSSAVVITAAITTANRMMAMLESNVEANFHRPYGDAHLNTPPGYAQSELQVFRNFFRTTHNQRVQDLAHDAHHGGTGSRDTQIFGRGIGPQGNGIGPYGEANVIARARYANNPLWVLTNPDAATFALGFTRDDD